VSQLLWFGLQSTELAITAAQVGSFTIEYSTVSLALIAGWLLVLSVVATRDAKIVGSGSTEYRRVVDATVRLFGLVAILMYLLKSDLGRGYFLTALPLGLALLLAGRWIQRRWLLRERAEGRFLHRALLVGNREKAEHAAVNILRDGSGSGLKLVGALTMSGSAGGVIADAVPLLGDFSDVLQILDSADVDTLIFTGADDVSPAALRELGWELEARGVDMIVVPSLTDVAGPRIHSRPVAGLPLIHVDFPVLEGTKYFAKRTFDVLFSVGLIIVLSPVLVAVAIAVKVTSAGPVFYRQERIGRGGEPFGMLKFRSMVPDADSHLQALLAAQGRDGKPLFKVKDDPRVTPVGRLLRKYSLDELPQLFNVVVGDMSIVGPRPQRPAEVALYDRAANRRLIVQPGMTGLWQVSGRSSLSWDDAVRLDLYYVENWSLVGDLAILMRTFRAVVDPGETAH
jgi:exopolysaccharide biosynthesis polyprenyl glycosylphosphotransferase